MSSLRSVIRSLILGLALVLGIASSALADDWTAIKLRGAVFAFVDNSWVQLARGDVVPDDRIIRTAPNGRVQFARGKETIDLGPDTQIRIFDRDGQKFTIVQQHFGDVAIEAERRDVQHFAVQTRYLAAVVKGTRFEVSADANSASVSVSRGRVEVRDVARKVMTEVNRGQSASVGSAQVLAVSGSGPRAAIVQYTGEPLAVDVTPVAVVDAGDATSVTVTTPSGTVTLPVPTTTSTESSATPTAPVTSTTTTSTTPATVTTTTPSTATTISTSASTTVPSVTTTTGTPAVTNTADTPAATVVSTTPAATNTTGNATSTTTSVTTSSDVGTPAVSNTADTPAATVVSNTPAATKTMPSTSNSGKKK